MQGTFGTRRLRRKAVEFRQPAGLSFSRLTTDIVHKPGRVHSNVDALSRVPHTPSNAAPTEFDPPIRPRDSPRPSVPGPLSHTSHSRYRYRSRNGTPAVARSVSRSVARAAARTVIASAIHAKPRPLTPLSPHRQVTPQPLLWSIKILYVGLTKWRIQTFATCNYRTCSVALSWTTWSKICSRPTTKLRVV